MTDAQELLTQKDVLQAIRTAHLKKQITIRLNVSTIEYFKQQAEETGISYQNLINMYLTDCAVHEKKLEYTIK